MQADSWEGLTSTLQAALLAVGLLDHPKSVVPSPSGPWEAVEQGKDGFNRLRLVAQGKLIERRKDAYLKPAQLWNYDFPYCGGSTDDWGLINLAKTYPIKVCVKFLCIMTLFS